MQLPQDIVIVGSGNIAHHFAKIFFSQGFTIKGILARNEAMGSVLARAVNSRWLDDFKHCPPADLIFIAVSDKDIPEVAEKLPSDVGIVVHSAGSAGIDLLARFPKHGILYPLQSFTVNKVIDFTQIPLLIEGNTPEVSSYLEQIAKRLSERVYHTSSEERRYVHLSAVFAGNFTNALYGIANTILQKHTRLDFDLLIPLIEESAQKVHFMTPKDAQTGPAKRGDESIISLHLELLRDEPRLTHLYRLLSEEIMRQQDEKL